VGEIMEREREINGELDLRNLESLEMPRFNVRSNASNRGGLAKPLTSKQAFHIREL
jgi:hypothetical protein